MTRSTRLSTGMLQHTNTHTLDSSTHSSSGLPSVFTDPRFIIHEKSRETILPTSPEKHTRPIFRSQH